MGADPATTYDELHDKLKDLFGEISELQAENERLKAENEQLRHEVSLLRLYLDMYVKDHEQESASDLDLSTAVSPKAYEFYKSMPDTLSLSDLFEMGTVLGVDRDDIKEYLRSYFEENMLEKQGTFVHKTGNVPVFLELFDGGETRSTRVGRD